MLQPDNRFFQFMSRLGDLIVLNVIFVISCIPLFTIGAALSALHTMIDKMSRGHESYIIRGYIQYLKENFKNSTIIWIVYLPIEAFLIIGGIYLAKYGSSNGILYIPYIFVTMILLFSFLYSFALQAIFVNTFGQILKNSLLTALRHLPYTLFLGIIVFLPLCISFLLPDFLPVTLTYWLLISFSFSAWLCGFIYRKVFAYYKR